MTYEELAGMLGCSVADARERAHAELLDRKISRDGRKRAKLNVELTTLFIQQLQAIDRVVDEAIDDLRHIHGLLQAAERPKALTSRLRRHLAG